MRHKSTYFAATLLLLAGSLEAATFYVATSGNDANLCSQSSPCRTIARGISRVAFGDTLMIGAGTYNEVINGNNLPNGGSWSSTTKIIGSGMTSTRLVATNDNHGIAISSAKQYIEFQDLELDGNNAQGNTGIYLDGGNRLRFRNIQVHHFRNQNVLSGATATEIEFLNLDAHHAGPNGTCYKAGGYCHGMYVAGDSNLIDGGRLHDNDGHGIQIYSAPESNLGAPDHNVVRNVRAYNNLISGIGTYFGPDNPVINCVSYNNGGHGIQLHSVNSVAYNNTLYNNNGGISSQGSGSQIRNNILYQTGGIENFSGALESNNLTTNPFFVNTAAGDFHLQANSPAINQGINLYSQGVTTDADGAARPASGVFEIGAYEFGAGSPVIRCDLDGSGAVNAPDIQLLVNAILTGHMASTYDINRDTLVNAIDLQVLGNVVLGVTVCP